MHASGVVNFRIRPLYFQRNSPRYSLNWRLGWTQGRSGRLGEERNTGSGRKTWQFLSWNKMTSILYFYANLLLKLSLSQSILITTFTSWIQCLWGGVPCCQHIPPSVSGSSTSLVAACWEKLLPLLPWCSVSNPPLSLVSFRTPCSCDILRGRSIATRDTRSDENWSADEISSESRQNRCFFWNTSPQQKPDSLQTSAPW